MNKKLIFIFVLFLLNPFLLFSAELQLISATASSTDSGNTPLYTIDGDLNTRWISAYSDPQWIAVELKNAALINKVVIHWEDAYATSYDIQLSSDNNIWNTIYSNNNGKGGQESISVPILQGKYLRIYGKSRVNSSWGYSIYEIKVYGTGGTNTAVQKNFNDSDVFKEIKILNSPFSPGGSNYYNDSVMVNYTLNYNAQVSVSIYSVPSTLLIYDQDLGNKQQNTFTWNGKDKNNHYVKNGLYLIRLKAKSDNGKSQEFTSIIAVIK